MRAIDSLVGMSVGIGGTHSAFWSLVARAMDLLQRLGPLISGLVVAALGISSVLTARRLQRDLVARLVAAPGSRVDWFAFEMNGSSPGLLWGALRGISRLARTVWLALRRIGRPPQDETTRSDPAPPLPSLLVATIGPSYLFGGFLTVFLFLLCRFLGSMIGFGLDLSPGAPTWQYLLVGARPELGAFFPLGQRSGVFAGLLAIVTWLIVASWASRAVRLVHWRALGGNRIGDRTDEAVLPTWRRLAGAGFLAGPDPSYLRWARWPVGISLPLLVATWFSLGRGSASVPASEFAVAFVLWLSWVIHLQLRGVERVPPEAGKTEVVEATAAGWPEVLAWLGERRQLTTPIEVDPPRRLAPLEWAEIPAELSGLISPLLLDFLPSPGRLTAMQRTVIRDLSLLAFVHVDPPRPQDRLTLGIGTDQVLEDRSGLRQRHQVVVAAEGSGKTTLALLAAANQILVHNRTALFVARDPEAEKEAYERFRDAVESTSLRWNLRIRRAGTDLMTDLSRGVTPDLVVASLQRLTVDLLGSLDPFLATLGLVVVDDIESFSGPVEGHVHFSLRRLMARACEGLGVPDSDRPGAPSMLVLGTDAMNDLAAWARSLCGVDAVLRDFTRSADDASEREKAEGAALGLALRSSPEAGASDDPASVREGRHQLFYRMRDFRAADGGTLRAEDLVAACEQLAVPWHYRACADGGRRRGRNPLPLRDEPRFHVADPLDACVVLLDGTWSAIRRERRRLDRAGARFDRRRRQDGRAAEGDGATEAIALVSLGDPDEEVAFSQLDRHFDLQPVLDRLPYPILRTPSRFVRDSHLASDLVSRWSEVEEIMAIYGAEAGATLAKLSTAGLLLSEPFTDVHPDGLRYVRKVLIRSLTRAVSGSLSEDAYRLPPPVADVESSASKLLTVRDRIRSLVLDRVDAAAADLLYYPGRIFHDARGSYVVVGRGSSAPASGEADDVEVEPVLVDDLTSPRRRIRVLDLPPARPNPASEVPAGPPAGPFHEASEPLLVGKLPIGMASLPVRLECRHLATVRLAPRSCKLRQRLLFPRASTATLDSWALALFPNPEGSPEADASRLTFDAARLVAATLRVILPSLLRDAAENLEIALRCEVEEPEPAYVLAPRDGFFLFDLAEGGNGAARALRRDKVEELLRLARLFLERVLDPSRLVMVYDHWGVEKELLGEEAADLFVDGGGERWQAARRTALIWLDGRLRPEGGAEGKEPSPARFASGAQAGEGDPIDLGRCWYSRDGAVTDLVWAKHHWRLRDDAGEATLDVGFDRETVVAARRFLESEDRLAPYRAGFAGLLANPAGRLADGTIWGAPRGVWMGDERSVHHHAEGLGEPIVADYASLAWGLSHQGFPALRPLARFLVERTLAEEERGDRVRTAIALVRFVQGIPFSLPSALSGGLRPAVSTLLYRLGDCDSKSLVLALLAQHCGIPSGLFISFAEGHAVAALAVPDLFIGPEPSAAPAPPSAEDGDRTPDDRAVEEDPVATHLFAWLSTRGLEMPTLWGTMPTEPGKEGLEIYLPVESTAYLPLGRVPIRDPKRWLFLPLVCFETEIATAGDAPAMPSDRAEQEVRT